MRLRVKRPLALSEIYEKKLALVFSEIDEKIGVYSPILLEMFSVKSHEYPF